MKLPVIILAVSLVANAAFVAAFALKPDRAPPVFRDVFARRSPTSDPAIDSARRGAATASVRAARADAQEAQLWSRLKADDLPSLVANLRAAGFSRVTIRAIVEAQLEAQFRSRMQALVGTISDTPFWKPEPTSSISNPAFFEQYNQIYRDRSKLLRQILGSDAFAYGNTDPTVVQRRQYGDISREKIDLIERINSDYQEMISQVRTGTQGITLAEDREKLALLEKEKKADLAAILTPQELEAYEMRTSSTTSRLRQAMTLMDASEDEFRTIYRIQQQYNDQINPTNVGYIGPDFMQQRQAAMTKAATEVKAAIGDARFAEYIRASSNEYQQLVRIGQRENIPNETLLRTYNLRETMAQESAKIVADPALSAQDKRAAVQALGQTARAQILGTLGNTAGDAYARTANWVTMLERGTPIAINIDGNVTTRPLVAAPKQ